MDCQVLVEGPPTFPVLRGMPAGLMVKATHGLLSINAVPQMWIADSCVPGSH